LVRHFFLILEPSRENASPEKIEEIAEPTVRKSQIPKGYIDASKISLGELSKIFKNDVKESALIEKFGEPATRNVSKNGQVILNYHFSNAGRESEDLEGFYVNGLVVVFSPTGEFVFWEITYEQFFKVE